MFQDDNYLFECLLFHFRSLKTKSYERQEKSDTQRMIYYVCNIVQICE